MSLSGREIKWLFIIILFFIAGWMTCVTEFQYWWWGQIVTATVVEREEYQGGREDRPTRMVTLTYLFHDEQLGIDRVESQDLRIGTLTEYKDPQIEIQFLPGSDGDSRLSSLVSRYFAVAFLAMNGLLAGVAFWGWRMLKADTWATNPGRR